MSANLIQALSKIDAVNEYILYKSCTTAPPITAAANFTEKAIPIERYSIAEHLHFSDIVNQDNPDIFHSTHQYLPYFFNIRGKRLVTVCDLFAPKYSRFFESHGPLKKHLARMYFDIMMGRTLRQADHIAAISQYTKDDIVSKYGVTPAKIDVIHLAAGNTMGTLGSNSLKDAPDLSRNKPFCLFVGNFKPYKNIKGAIESVSLYNSLNPARRICLIVVGNDEKNLPAISKYVREKGSADSVIFMKYVSDDTLAVLYKEAEFLLFPSLFEGFGLPVLEAMRAGLPVICSNTTSLPEIAGGAALMVSPNSPIEIAHAISQLRSAGIRSALITKGYETVKSFTWEKTAKQYLRLYTELDTSVDAIPAKIANLR